MYEALQPVVADLVGFEAALNSPTRHTRVARLTAALDATAQQMSDRHAERLAERLAERPAERLASATGERERVHLQTLYRGFVAASRIVQRLSDLKAQAGEEV